MYLPSCQMKSSLNYPLYNTNKSTVKYLSLQPPPPLLLTHVYGGIESYEDIVVFSNHGWGVGKHGTTCKISSHTIVSNDECTSLLSNGISKNCHIVAEKIQPIYNIYIYIKIYYISAQALSSTLRMLQLQISKNA